jgi:hypothetical protein
VETNYKYIDRAWWLEYLENLFPEQHYTPLPEWHLHFPFYQMQHEDIRWFKKDNLILGILFHDRQAPKLYIRALNSKTLIINHTVAIANKFINDELLVIESIAKPELIPLCLGIDWAEPLIEYLLANPISGSSVPV